MRKRQEARATAEEDAFLQRLRQKKAVVGESLEREKAGRKFEPTGPVTAPPPHGADEGVPVGPAVFTPQPPPPPPTAKPEEPADDYFSKLRQAKKRAPHEKDKDE
jgi:hypothetical protein